MTIAMRGVDEYMVNLRTRMPFRFGIVTLTKLPHMFVRLAISVDGRVVHGVASESLPPKWFTKDPDKQFETEIDELVGVILAACHFARDAGDAPTVYDLWRRIYDRQMAWGKRQRGYPPLLYAFGATLVERALISAYCRATGTTFAEAVRTNALGVRLGDHYPDLAGRVPAEYLPARPLREIIARHTVGLVDPLTATEIPPENRIDDGLPQALDEVICAYGLTHFKLKLWGDERKDHERLKAIARVIEENAGADYAITLDGNENYHEIEPFRSLWSSLAGDAELAPFLAHLIFAEQPLHRNVALDPAAAAHIRGWPERPPMIIDESDGELATLATALASGYAGTSHKNCKGVFKSIANACLIAECRRRNPTGQYIMSGEDLTNIGPVALPEDLAVLATLGIDHAERNGHHYFRGLSMFPAAVQDAVLAHHGDLYRRHERGFPTLDVRNGRIRVGSCVDAPFGVAWEFDPTEFTPLDAWSIDSLLSE